MLKAEADKAWLKLSGGEEFCLQTDRPVSAGDVLLLGIRPEHLQVGTGGDVGISLKVDVVEALGGTTFAYTQYAGEDQVVVVTDGGHIIPKGKNMQVSFNLEHVHLFDTQTGGSLLQHQKSSRFNEMLAAM